jgi:surface carbohydrate biosynthesis protein
MSERPWLIIPIETKARELDAKTYVACAAAEAGFRVTLGEQNGLLRRLALLPRGFYLDKSIARPKIPVFERLNKLGFRVLAWCEEGLVYLDRDTYVRERVAPAALDRTEAFFAWGGVQSSDILSAVPEANTRILEVGNPRSDLLRPELREFYRPAADFLRSRFGEFILINTNFGRYNHYFGQDQFLQILRKRGLITSSTDEVLFRRWFSFVREVFHSFEDMLPRLASAFPDRNIVLRPHPSENHDTWRRIAAEIPNVHVIHEGSVVPWLLAAQLSIHNGCTTGVEGALLERPVLAYCKARLEGHYSLPDRMSLSASSFDELVGMIESTLAGRYQAPLTADAALRTEAGRHLASLDGPAATDVIVAKLVDLAGAPSPIAPGKLVDRVRDQAEQTLRTAARKALAPWRSSGGYSKQKFPGLEIDEVTTIVDRYRALTGRFNSVQVRPRHPSVVTIETNQT